MLDLVQNAVEAKARRVSVVMATRARGLSVCIEDDGCGMDERTRTRALDPFFTNGEKHRNRRFGLGLPFLRQQMETVSGTLQLTSAPGKGTTVSFSFDPTHLDAPPLCDLPETLLTMMNFPGEYELLFERRTSDASYAVSRNELIEALGGLNTADELATAKRYIAGLDEDFNTTLNER